MRLNFRNIQNERTPSKEKQVVNISEENKIIKTSEVGKVKTKIRKTVPSDPMDTMNTTTVKRKYILTKKNQLKKN